MEIILAFIYMLVLIWSFNQLIDSGSEAATTAGFRHFLLAFFSSFGAVLTLSRKLERRLTINRLTFESRRDTRRLPNFDSPPPDSNTEGIYRRDKSPSSSPRCYSPVRYKSTLTRPHSCF